MRLSKNLGILMLLLMVVPLLAFSCHGLIPGGGGNESELAGTTWVLENFRELDALFLVIFEAPVTLTFEADGTLHGVSGCNNYLGVYKVDGSSISIGGLAVTEKACLEPEGIMEQEQQYIDALLKVDNYRIFGDRLVLNYDDDVRSLDFRQRKQSTSELADTSWMLESFRELDMLLLPVENTEVTLTFSSDGTISGSAGCNLIFGEFSTTGNRITFSHIGSTKIACRDEVAQQEQRFLDGLENAETYLMADGRLNIQYNGGDYELNFVPME